VAPSPIIAENGDREGETNNNDQNGLLVKVNKTPTATASSSSRNSGLSPPSDVAIVDDVFNSTEVAAEGDETSPTVRDFTKKNDSVSYVLDLGAGASSATLSPALTLPSPASPWARRRNLVRFSSLRYPHHSTH